MLGFFLEFISYFSENCFMSYLFWIIPVRFYFEFIGINVTSQGKRPGDALMEGSKQQTLQVTAKAVPGIRCAPEVLGDAIKYIVSRKLRFGFTTTCRQECVNSIVVPTP